MALTENEIVSFDQDGYVIFRNLFSEKEVCDVTQGLPTF